MSAATGAPIAALGSVSPQATITITGGRGNTKRREIHIAMRADIDGRAQLIQGWFDADDVNDAISDAGRTPAARLSEPAATE